MEKMKSLADKLREEMAKPAEKSTKLITNPPARKDRKAQKKAEADPILQSLKDYDNSDHKNMVHARFDKHTVDIMNKFKMATGVEVTKFVAFAVRQLIDNNPGIKAIIKEFIQNTDL